MNTVITNTEQLPLLRLNFKIKSVEDTLFDGWLGSFIRNNLLYATGLIEINEGQTLLDKINTFPLPAGHPCYNTLCNGFPKGYVLQLHSHCAMDNYDKGKLPVCRGEEILFSIVLIGSMMNQASFFTDAVMLLCKRGMGSPVVPFTMEEFGKEVLPEIARSISPVHKLSIRFVTPVMLYKPVVKKETNLSYQDKMNGFPSFYQLIRSVVHRVTMLSLIYGQGKTVTAGELEKYLSEAARTELQMISVRRFSIYGSRRNNEQSRIIHSGYVGEMEYKGNLGKYTGLLSLARYLSVGDNTVYGMGQIYSTVQASR